MKDSDKIRIEILDVDPQQSPDHCARVIFDSNNNEPVQDFDIDHIKQFQQDAAEHIVRIRHERRNLPSKIKMAFYAGGAALALFGGYNIYKGLTSGGGSHMQAEVTVDETRVTVYENPPIQLAGINSDLDLTITAGYDRTGPIPGIDINPINNMYDLNQKDLTTHTEATLSIESMVVEESGGETLVTLSGDMDLGRASIDWNKEEFAGADISGTSYSVGNDLKDRIDNDALEILQSSSEVTAACAMLDKDIQPAITRGVEAFLQIVKPELRNKNEPVRVLITDLESQAQRLYIDAKDALQATLQDIESDYDGNNDTFEADISQILDCKAQNIRLTQS